MPKQTWTEEMNAYLRDAWERRQLSANQCADEIYRDLKIVVTRNAVIGRVSRLGISARKIQNNRVPKPKHERRVAVQTKGGRISSVRANVTVAKPAALPILKAVVAPPAPPGDRPGVALMDLRERHCRWPMWSFATASAEKRFCGEPVIPGKSYCAHCHTLSMAPRALKEAA